MGKPSERKITVLEDVENFEKLMDAEWNASISHYPVVTLDERKFNKPELLPITSDLQKLKQFMFSQICILTVSFKAKRTIQFRNGESCQSSCWARTKEEQEKHQRFLWQFMKAVLVVAVVQLKMLLNLSLTLVEKHLFKRYVLVYRSTFKNLKIGDWFEISFLHSFEDNQNQRFRRYFRETFEKFVENMPRFKSQNYLALRRYSRQVQCLYEVHTHFWVWAGHIYYGHKKTKEAVYCRFLQFTCQLAFKVWQSLNFGECSLLETDFQVFESVMFKIPTNVEVKLATINSNRKCPRNVPNSFG